MPLNKLNAFSIHLYLLFSLIRYLKNRTSFFYLPAVVNTLTALVDGDPVGTCVLQLFPVQQSISHSNKVNDLAIFK